MPLYSNENKKGHTLVHHSFAPFEWNTGASIPASSFHIYTQPLQLNILKELPKTGSHAL